MRAGPTGRPAGIVFRPLRTDAERALARSLPAATGRARPAREEDGLVWFGLWDLAADEGETLLGAAATRTVTAATAELCALAVADAPPWRGLGDRLLREVADTLRAQGVERMVARLEGDDGRLALLRDAGLVPLPDRQRQELARGDPRDAGVWLSLEL